MSFRNAAAAIVAKLFRLINANGQVVADLSPATDPVFSGLGNALNMYHLDSEVRDSSLFWTEANPGYQQVALVGPSLTTQTSPMTYILLTQNQVGSGTPNVATAEMSVGQGNFPTNKYSIIRATAAIAPYGGASISLEATNRNAIDASILLDTDGTMDFTWSEATMNGRTIYPLVSIDRVEQTAANTITTVASQPVTTTVALLAGDIVEIQGQVNYSVTAAGVSVATATLLVNGATMTDSSSAGVDLNAGVGRWAGPLNGLYIVPSDGNYTFAINTVKTLAAGTVATFTASTSFIIKVYSKD